MNATPSRKFARIAPLVAVPAALVLSGVIVGQASYSAFSGQTDNSGNNWATGTVNLTDDDKGEALFVAKNMKPGHKWEKCITVTSNGSLPATVKLFAEDATAANALDSHITLKVAQSAACGTAGTTIFEGSMDKFAKDHSAFANAAGSWETDGTAGEKQAYTIGFVFSPDAPNSTQASTASLGFTWEAQNK